MPVCRKSGYYNRGMWDFMKMGAKLFGFIILYLNFASCSVHRSHRIIREESNDLQQSSDLSIRNEGNNSVIGEKSDLISGLNFWVLRDENNGTELESGSNVDNEVKVADEITTVRNEESTAIQNDVLSDLPLPDSGINQAIFLQRNSCNVEFLIKEAEDMKMKIMYESLQNGMIGHCEVQLSGRNGILLAVLVSNVRLSVAVDSNRRNVSNEILRIVTRRSNFNFTLVEYRGWEEYYPVVLTDTDQAYLVLSYHGITSTKEMSSFDLEVFNYYKQSKIHPAYNDEYSPGYNKSDKNVDDVYITTALP